MQSSLMAINAGEGRFARWPCGLSIRVIMTTKMSTNMLTKISTIMTTKMTKKM